MKEEVSESCLRTHSCRWGLAKQSIITTSRNVEILLPLMLPEIAFSFYEAVACFVREPVALCP